MSWHCSQALVEDFSALGYLDSDQCTELSSVRTVGKASFAGRKKATWSPFPSGTMSRPLTVYRGVALWMSSLLDSRANHSLRPESRKPTTILETCGQPPCESFAKYNRGRRYWKTCRDSQDMPIFTKSWGGYAKAGLMHDGQLYPQPEWEPRTSENDSGYWPTPNTEGFRSDGELRQLARKVTNKNEFRGMSERAAESKRQRFFPTPTVSCANGARNATALRKHQEKHNTGVTLNDYVTQFPTPTANDWKGGTSTARKDTGKPRRDRLDHLFEPTSTGGKLNPRWVEWLMGWPIGWTSLEPLETDRFHQWLQKLGGISPAK